MDIEKQSSGIAGMYMIGHDARDQSLRWSLQKDIQGLACSASANMAWIISSILDTIEPTDDNFDKIMGQIMGKEYIVETDDYKADLKQRQADKERLQDFYDNVRSTARQYDKKHTPEAL